MLRIETSDTLDCFSTTFVVKIIKNGSWIITLVLYALDFWLYFLLLYIGVSFNDSVRQHTEGILCISRFKIAHFYDRVKKF